MLTYKQYLSESVYKLTRVESGIFSVRDPQLQETGIILDQNYSYGKCWDIMVEGVSKGTFKTKHQAILFIETSPSKLIESYSVLTLVDESKTSYLDKVTNLIYQKTGKVVDNLMDYPMWKLVEVDSKLVSAELYSDKSYRKLVISV
tara:strand:- start:784 stop:1221 length:438 start_codon:yes stop_codon:yes gene_type:complete